MQMFIYTFLFTTSVTVVKFKKINKIKTLLYRIVLVYYCFTYCH